MIKEYNVIYDGWAVPTEFKSDGCTVPKMFQKITQSWRWDKTACRLHDFHRRHKILSVNKSDMIFIKQIYAHNPGVKFFTICSIIYLFLKVTYPLFSGTQTMPKRWEKYRINNFKE